MAERKSKPYAQEVRRLRLGVAGIVLVALLASGAGWYWKATLPVKTITVSGVVYSNELEISAAAAVDSSVMLFEVEPDSVAVRVSRLPWVKNATVTRLPTGTLSIAVDERRPAVLALNATGRLSHYIDATGYHMPLVNGAAFDVPLLRGDIRSFTAGEPELDESLLEMLETLAVLPADQHALISEIRIIPTGEIEIRTAPLAGQGAIPVLLGRTGYSEKLKRLAAFWRQAVLAKSQVRFTSIDLRFDNQIVTRETEQTTG